MPRMGDKSPVPALPILVPSMNTVIFPRAKGLNWQPAVLSISTVQLKQRCERSKYSC
jgi:hypothetical protein